MIDEKKIINDIKQWSKEREIKWTTESVISLLESAPKIGGWIPCSEGNITAEQKCIADLVNFAMTVSDRLKKKDFSLFSPTSGIGGGMKIGLPPICRMSDELLSLHEDIINEAVRAKRNE